MRERARRRRAFAAAVALSWAASCTVVVPLPGLSPGEDGAAPPEDATPGSDQASSPDAPEPTGLDAAACTQGYRPRESRILLPQVIFAIERTIAMLGMELHPGALSRRDAVRDAILPSVRTLGGAVKFGYEEYPARGTCDSACCPASDVLVRPNRNSAGEIERYLRCDKNDVACFTTPAPLPHTWEAQIPSDDALARIRKFYAPTQGEADGRFVVLITAGDPCCGDACQRECDAAAAETRALAESGVKTIVLGIGDSARSGVHGSSCLERLAEAGQLAGSGTSPKYPWTDQAGQKLEDAVKQVLDRVLERTCQLRINEDIDPDRTTVLVNSDPIERDPDHHEGWDWDPGAPLIRLWGSSCSRLGSGDLDPTAIVVKERCCMGAPDCR